MACMQGSKAEGLSSPQGAGHPLSEQQGATQRSHGPAVFGEAEVLRHGGPRFPARGSRGSGAYGRKDAD